MASLAYELNVIIWFKSKCNDILMLLIQDVCLKVSFIWFKKSDHIIKNTSLPRYQQFIVLDCCLGSIEPVYICEPSAAQSAITLLYYWSKMSKMWFEKSGHIIIKSSSRWYQQIVVLDFMSGISRIVIYPRILMISCTLLRINTDYSHFIENFALSLFSQYHCERISEKERKWQFVLFIPSKAV